MDDPAPREYFRPEPPKETTDAVKEEVRKAEQAQPFIEGVMEWFDLAIDNTNHLDAVMAEARRRRVSIEVAAQAYDMVREILMQKQGEFISLKMTFDK
jgi:hemoglobin-like flavoprotein